MKHSKKDSSSQKFLKGIGSWLHNWKLSNGLAQRVPIAVSSPEHFPVRIVQRPKRILLVSRPTLADAEKYLRTRPTA